MRKKMMSIALATVSAAGLISQAAPVLAQSAPATQPTRYSVETTLVGKLLDDPAAAAVLKQHIPTVYANEQFQSAGRNLTLKDIQQYEPEALSDENLAKIQATLDKLPVKN